MSSLNSQVLGPSQENVMAIQEVAYKLGTLKKRAMACWGSVYGKEVVWKPPYF